MAGKKRRALGIALEIALEIVNTGTEGTGVCHACGEEASGVNGWVEPDACKYKCEHCGDRAVYGAEETLFILGGE